MQKEVQGIAPAAMDQLAAHDWPGNIRELEHVIQRAVALSTGDWIKDFVFAPGARSRPDPTLAAGSDAGIMIPIGTTVNEATRRLVGATLEQCGGNKMRAARILGIPPRTMYRHFGGWAG
jgi:DNA-binding NtrC family response regulator